MNGANVDWVRLLINWFPMVLIFVVSGSFCSSKDGDEAAIGAPSGGLRMRWSASRRPLNSGAKSFLTLRFGVWGAAASVSASA